LSEAIAHRARREAQLLQALGEGPRGVKELARQLYEGLPDDLVRWAELQLVAGLEKLRREGRVELVDGEKWALVTG
jgi:hypothetical protein